MDVVNLRKVHMTGVKGAGMTALAQLLALRGVDIVGSDVNEKFFTDDVLERAGITVKQFSADNITTDLDAVIFSTAYNSTHEELARANEIGVPLISYPEAVAQLFNASWGIAIAGSHGKTTTSALLGFIMREIGMDPTALIGSKVIDFGGNAIAGRGEKFVIEADEYQNKLFYYHPKIALITSIDYDHPDIFLDRAAYARAFYDFSKRTLEEGGEIVVCIDDEGVAEMLRELPNKSVITYGWHEDADYRIDNYSVREGITHFTVTCRGVALGEFSSPLVGRHNASNACGVIAVLDALKVDDWGQVATIMARFGGTARRFERRGVFGEVQIIDDYAHHPTEVRVTLAAAREIFPDKRIWCVFAAHTFSRTEALMDEFAVSFGSVDRVLLLDIFSSAREQAGVVSARDLCELIGQHGVIVDYVGTLEAAADYVREHCDELDILITMGAGDAWRVGDMLLGRE